MKKLTLLVILIIISTIVLVAFTNNSSVPEFPSSGFVPDEKTAIKVAEAIWYPIYGDEIYEEKPYKAELKDDVWLVRGTLNYDVGGVAYIEIQKSDCKILKVTHGK